MADQPDDVTTQANRTNTPPPPWVLALMNAALVALVARLFAPILLAPAVAAISVTALAADPYLRRRSQVTFLGLTFTAAVCIPAVLEHLGWASITTELGPMGLVLHPVAALSPHLLLPLLLLHTSGIVTAAIVFGRTMRKHELGLRRQLHLQAWQLRQLVTG